MLNSLAENFLDKRGEERDGASGGGGGGGGGGTNWLTSH